MGRNTLPHLLLVIIVSGVCVYLFFRIVNLALISRDSAVGADGVTAGSLAKFDNASLPKRVLVTGGAGFIGFHLAKTLASQHENLVIVLDNFNDYYDVSLKIDRAFELHQLGVIVINDDVCNTGILEELFTEYNFTHVAHLAAQAGVRYSLQNPLAYVRANVECQVALLDILRDFPHIKLIYASSSSVYGKKSHIPFSLSDKTDHPGNMYAATKKTDELLAYHYCMAYNITSIGLRFFTVYGPLGRPDMAIYKFAESILDGRDVPMYSVSEAQGHLGRDFTYIDDVITGIMSALLYSPDACGERFNLGFGDPVSLPDMVDILQQELGITAHVKKLPLPPTEILRTWADITLSTKILGFKPKTNLKEGVKRFVVWYRGYRKLRHDQDQLGLPSKASKWFSNLERERDQRAERYRVQAIKSHNDRLKKRLADERLKYNRWAQAHGVPVPEFKDNMTFTFYQGMDSPGFDIKRENHLRNDIEGLKEKCREVLSCVGFNSEGVLKSRLHPRNDWKKVPFFTNVSQGLYAIDMDLCKADLHDCSKYANCIPILPARFSCKCKAGFHGNGKDCLPEYSKARPEELEWECAAQQFSIYNLTEMKQNASMIFFQGLDAFGGDYMLARDLSGDKLKEICRKDPLCIAVNSNGYMKLRLETKDKWKRWSDVMHHGIYVFDINYCQLNEYACPNDAYCVQFGPADYRCECRPPLEMVENQCVAKKSLSPINTSESKPEKLSVPQGKTDIVKAKADKANADPLIKKTQKDDTKVKTGSNHQTEEVLSREKNGKDKTGHLIQKDKNKQGLIEDVSGKKKTQDLQLQEEEDEVDPGDSKTTDRLTAHIILSVDVNDYESLPTLLNSLSKHTSGSVVAHIIHCGVNENEIKSYLACFTLSSTIQVQLVEFETVHLDTDYLHYMRVQAGDRLGYLSSCANYARFFFHRGGCVYGYRVLPGVHRAVYLDADTLIQADFMDLWKLTASHASVISAVSRDSVRYQSYFNDKVSAMFKDRYGHTLKLGSSAFNAGVYHVNLDMWRNQSEAIDEELRFWMKQQVKHRLWKLGTQALMLLTFHDRWDKLPPAWNLDGLGYRENIPSQQIESASLLHWTGSSKPWKDSKNPYYRYWVRLRPQECKGHRSCVSKEKGNGNTKWREWLCATSAES